VQVAAVSETLVLNKWMILQDNQSALQQGNRRAENSQSHKLLPDKKASCAKQNLGQKLH
jgi:hypothetical protein